MGKMRWMRSKLLEYQVSQVSPSFMHFLFIPATCVTDQRPDLDTFPAALQDVPSNGFRSDFVTALHVCARNLLGLTRKKQEPGESCRRIGNHAKLFGKKYRWSQKPQAASFVHVALSSWPPTRDVLNVTPGRQGTSRTPVVQR